MRNQALAALTAVALALTACGSDDASTAVEEDASSTDAPGGTASDEEQEPEGEARAEDALFGVDVCRALLPALDGQREGLDRHATPEVIDALFHDGDPMSDAAEVYANEDGSCGIAIADWWIDLVLQGDGHVGHRAVDFTEHTSADGGGPGFDPEAVAAAVADHRASVEACEGSEGERVDDDFDHYVLEAADMMVVAVLCEAFAYQSTWELLAWDGGQLVGLDVEQWRDGSTGYSPLVLGYPYLDDDGALVNLEKARGPGDCGLWQRWFVGSPTMLGLAEAREKACDDGAEYVEPDQWPVVHPTGD